MSNIDPQNELLVLYLSESGQMVGKFERLMMESNQSGKLQEAPEMFRILHTLKGASGMMEYAPLVEAAHAFEDILALIKAEPQKLRGEQLQAVTDLGLEFSSYFSEELAHINNAIAPQRDEKLLHAIEKLGALLGGAAKPAATATGAAVAVNDADTNDGKLWVLVKLKKCPLPNIRASIIAKSVSKLCAVVVTNPENIDQAAQYSDAILSGGFEVGLIPLSSVTAEDIIKKISAQPYVVSCRLQNGAEAGESQTQQAEAFERLQTITVAQPLVNSLMSLMNEIASAEGAVEIYTQEAGYDSRRMQELLSALRRTIAEADMIVSQIGTHAVGSVFMQMQRAIRSMAKALHKEIRVSVTGDDVQVDKSILEILSDSMIHMVRNAADHGIGLPDDREAHGKPRAGLITLSAARQNDYLTVTVSDDGAGINRRAVLDKAERSGKLTKPRELYSDKDIGNLLLSSGVSTNPAVTQYSGRGVGLNTAVRRVRQSGGSVSVESAEGRGTTFTLKIPITLTVLDAIEIALMDGSELLVPANAVRHIAATDSAPERYDYQGKSYKHILFPGWQAGADAGEGYTLLLERDFGPYYIRAKSAGMLSAYYVKQMPEFVADALGRGYIYSGCVLCAGGKLRCILDVARLIEISETGELAEGRGKL